ncbi:MAG: hypothetical protein B7Y47_04970 [Sphingomonas sp. 28-63-12]|nr:MAG: hypothetical protein B7Y47_04970 [Sphingomonas sp. 28-63-12]
MGHQAATDYALLYGVGRLVGTLALLGLPTLIASIGWRGFYLVSAAAVVCSVGYFIARPKVGSACPRGTLGSLSDVP